MPPPKYTVWSGGRSASNAASSASARNAIGPERDRNRRSGREVRGSRRPRTRRSRNTDRTRRRTGHGRRARRAGAVGVWRGWARGQRPCLSVARDAVACRNLARRSIPCPSRSGTVACRSRRLSSVSRRGVARPDHTPSFGRSASLLDLLDFTTRGFVCPVWPVQMNTAKRVMAWPRNAAAMPPVDAVSQPPINPMPSVSRSRYRSRPGCA